MNATLPTKTDTQRQPRHDVGLAVLREATRTNGAVTALMINGSNIARGRS